MNIGSAYLVLCRLWPWPRSRSVAGLTIRVRARDLDQSGSIHLEDILSEQPSRLLGGGHYLVVAMFLSLILVASVIKVDVIVSAPGRLAADAPPIVVQPAFLSVIREIAVKAGDVVHKGDVLATLDPTLTRADSDTLLIQKNALEARIRRLDAELAHVRYESARDSSADVLQDALYQQRQLQYQSRLRGFGEDIARYQDDIRTTEQNRGSLEHELVLAREVEAIRGSLYQDRVGSKLSYLDAQATRMHTEREYEDLNSRLTDLRHSLQSSETGRQVFVEEWLRQLLEELSNARDEFNKVNGELTKSNRLSDLVQLTAPGEGIVLEVAKRSVGSVLNAAETLVTIVPTNAPLIADVMISSVDAGYAKLGDEVMIKVDAFSYIRHGTLRGRLRSIGEDTSPQDGSGVDMRAPGNGSAVFHRSRVELTDTTLIGLPSGAHPFPGMSVTAEIKVGSRSVISYFLDPILRGFRESIREP